MKKPGVIDPAEECGDEVAVKASETIDGHGVDVASERAGLVPLNDMVTKAVCVGVTAGWAGSFYDAEVDTFGSPPCNAGSCGGLVVACIHDTWCSSKEASDGNTNFGTAHIGEHISDDT